MASERQPGIRLTGLHIDLVDRVVTLDAEDGRKARLPFGEPKTFATTLPDPESGTPDELLAGDDPSWEEMMPPESAAPPRTDTPPPAPDSREKQQTITLTGSLRTQPRPGRPDAQGNPTAWARIAVQEEDSEQDRVYSATFHRDATAAALALTRADPITVEGYLHAGDTSRKQPDRLSVIAVRNHAGELQSRPRRGVT